MNTINSLLSVSEQIGDIKDSNGHFTEGLARRVDQTGKPLDDFTISELITLMDQYCEFYNTSLSGSMESDSIVVDKPKKITLDELLARQDSERGFDLIPIDFDLLLKRVKDGGYSGLFLADAFISYYRTDQPFNHSLGKVLKLDAEAFRILHSILHLRFIPGWNDQELYDIEQEIKNILAGEGQ
ncbi:MAG: hypothetical protein GQ532_02150 [Methylomarinum sp.]|nr:hypothetical protein [Methylomarinum sp.]